MCCGVAMPQVVKMKAKHEKLLRQGLPAVAGISLILPFFLDTQGFPLNEVSEIKVKLCLMVGTLAAILFRALPHKRLNAQRAGNLLTVAAIIASLAYLNFGAFHGRVYNHFWEQFHYVLGAKYFPELGYDGLYAASIEAQTRKNPEAYRGQIQPVIRDLRTNEMVSTQAPETREHRTEVKERFSDERWSEFIDDNYHFLWRNTPGYITSIRRDHGFNPPPSWTFVARLFAWPEINDSSLAWMANLDLILLITMFVVVFRTYGSRIGCISLILFGLNYAGRYYWVGGAFLREDWLACSVIGICMLKREKYFAAGAFIGWATAVRVFPVLFLFGPGILGLRALMRREPLKWSFQIVGGFVLAILVALAAGSLTGRGPAAWSEFADAITLHRGTWLTNNVGLENVILYDMETMQRKLVNFSLPEPWIHWQAKMDRLKEERSPIVWGARGMMLLILAMTCWRARVDDAAAISGMVAIFAMVVTTCYYWQMLLIIPFLRSKTLLYGAIGLNIFMAVLHFLTPSFEMRYGLYSWGLLILFLSYLLPRAWKEIQDMRSAGEAEPAAA